MLVEFANCDSQKSVKIYFLIDFVYTYLLTLQENEQRCAAELVYGIIIGSKFWPYEYVESVWAELLPILKTVVPNISDETIKDWEICMSGATNRVDPNRYF